MFTWSNLCFLLQIDTALKNKLHVNDNNADASSEQKIAMAVNRSGKSSFDVLSLHDDTHIKIAEKNNMNIDRPGTSNLSKAYQESQIDHFLSGKYESANYLDKVATISDTSSVHNMLEENHKPSHGFFGLSGDRKPSDGNAPRSLCEMSMDGGSLYDNRAIKISARPRTSSTYQGTQPLFSRGFLNKPARKKSLQPQLLNQGICVSNADKCNSVSEMELMSANPDNAGHSYDSHNKHVNGETNFQVENGKTDCSFEDGNVCIRKPVITNIESNGLLTKLCVDSRTVEVSVKDIRENGSSRDRQCYSKEISPEKDSEQDLQICDSQLDLICENGTNSLTSSLLSASNGFISKVSRVSGDSNGISKFNEMDPSEEASLKHISCSQTVSGSDTNGFSDVKASILPNGFPDFKAPIFPNGFLTKSREDNKICIKDGLSGKTNKSLERNSKEYFVSCQEMRCCSNNTDELGNRKSDLQFSSNGGYLSKSVDGCPNRIESNGYSDCSLLRSGIIGRAELSSPLKNKETDYEHDRDVSRKNIEECC